MNLKLNLATFGFVFAILACDTLATKWYMDVAEDISRPNMCYDKIMDEFFELNDSWRRPHNCERVSCAPGDEEGMMTITGSTCPFPIRLPNNCRMNSSRPRADYPDCCPEITCKGEPQGDISMVG